MCWEINPIQTPRNLNSFVFAVSLPKYLSQGWKAAEDSRPPRLPVLLRTQVLAPPPAASQCRGSRKPTLNQSWDSSAGPLCRTQAFQTAWQPLPDFYPAWLCSKSPALCLARVSLKTQSPPHCMASNPRDCQAVKCTCHHSLVSTGACGSRTLGGCPDRRLLGPWRPSAEVLALSSPATCFRSSHLLQGECHAAGYPLCGCT